MTDLPAPPVEQLLDLPALAALLHLSPSTIRSLRTTGDGPRAIRIGGSVRWRRTDVDAWVDAHAEPVEG
ncbi:MAG: helix-turn-helix transcriptional regulator [Cellulomonas sp.]